MSDRLEVCPAEELPPGERQIVSQGRVSIGVFNVDGDYHAILNSCPHQHGPLCEGEVTSPIDAEFETPGRTPEQEYTDGTMLVCPWHHWAFDVETGEHVGDEDISVPTFDVTVEDGVVYVES